MHDIGTPAVACAVRTSTLHAAIFRAHGARYCMKAQVYECINFMQSDLGALMAEAKAIVFIVDDDESVREALGRLGTHATIPLACHRHNSRAGREPSARRLR